MKKKTRIVMTLIIPILFVAVFVLVLLGYTILRNEREETLRNEALLSAVSEQKARLKLLLNGGFTALGVFSDSVSATDAVSAQAAQEQMRRMLVSTSFQEILLTDSAGNEVAHAGSSALTDTAKLLQPTLKGERIATFASMTCTNDGCKGMILSVPVWQGGRVTGAVAGVLGRATLSDLVNGNEFAPFDTAIFTTEAKTVFAEVDGSQTQTDGDLLDWLGISAAEREKLEAQLELDLKNEAQGLSLYQCEGERWYFTYTPLEQNGLYVGMSIPASRVEPVLRVPNSEGYELLAIIMVGALMLMLFVILRYRNESRRSLQERERLMTAEEEYRIAAKQGGIMVARFDIESGALLSSQGTIDHLQMQLDAVGFSSYSALEKLVAAESTEDFRALWAMVRGGKPNGQAEVCLLGADGTKRWYTVEFSAIGDGGGTSVQAIVTIRDINELHERMTAYRHWQNHILTSLGIYAALMEVNLTTGVYERLEGEFLDAGLPDNADFRAEPLLECFLENAVDEGSRQRFQTFASLSRLRDLAARGIQKDEAEIWLAREDGAQRLCLLTAQMAPLPKTGEIKAFLTLQELNDINLEIERLSNLALYDELSGLLNRTAARNAIEETLRYGTGERVALFMIDADNFKLVNDTLGHQHGDLALIQLSQAIKSVFRASDILARIGGDEFFVFLPEVAGDEVAQSKAAALCNALHLTYTAGNSRGIELTASIGVVIAQRNQVDYETLYAEADRALYEAKKAGKNRYCIHTPDQTVASKPSQPQLVGYELQMQSLLKHLDGGVVMFEVGERIQPIFISDGYFMLRGVMADAIENGTFPESTIHPHDLPLVNQAVRTCVEDGVPFQISYRNVLADGGYGWRHMNAIRVPSLTEDRPILLAVISDITELHAATEHLKAVSDQRRVGILIMRVGERLEITFFNDGALAITGFTYEQMRLFSRDASAFFRGNNLLRFRAEVRAANTENRLVDFLYQSQGFVGKGPHQTHLYGVKLDVQNGVPSYLILMVDKNPTEPNPER